MLEYNEPTIDKKCAMVTFADNARKDFDFLPQLTAKRRIDSVTFLNGGTNTQAGLAMALDILNRGTWLSNNA